MSSLGQFDNDGDDDDDDDDDGRSTEEGAFAKEADRRRMVVGTVVPSTPSMSSYPLRRGCCAKLLAHVQRRVPGTVAFCCCSARVVIPEIRMR